MARTFELGLRLKSILDSTGFDKLRKNVDDIGRRSAPALKSLGEGLQNIEKRATQLGRRFRVLSVASTAALAGSIKSFGDFEDGIKGVQTLLDDDSFANLSLQEGVDGLAEGVKALSGDLGLGLDDLNKALFDTVSAGVAADDAIKTLGVSGKLAVAGLTSISTATTGITSALNAYGDEAGTAEEVASKFFAAQKAGATTVEQLASGFGLVGASAEGAGISLDELLAAVSAITLGGVKTSAAFTGLKAAIAGVSKPTEDAAREAKRLGIVFNADSLRENGLTDFIKNITENPNFGPNTIAQLFGSTEAQNAINNLIKQTETYGKTVANLGDQSGSVKTLNEAFLAQSSSTGKAIDRLQAKFKVLFINIGQQLAPSFVKVADALGDFLDKINNSTGIQKLTIGVLGFTAALSPMFFALAKFGPFLGDLLVKQAGLNKAVGGFAGPSQLFAGGLERAGTIVGTLIGQVVRLENGMGSLLKRFVGFIKPSNLFRTASTAIGTAFTKLGVIFGQARFAIDVLINRFANFGSILRGIGTRFASAGAGVLSFLKPTNLLRTSLGSLTRILTTVRNAVSLKVVAITALISVFVKIEKETGVFSTLLGTLFDIIGNVVTAVVDFTEKLFAADTGISALDDSVEFLKDNLELLKTIGDTVLNGLIVSIAGLLKGITSLAGFFGKKFDLISPAALKRLQDADKKLGDLVAKSAKKIRVNLGLEEPDPREVAGALDETEKKVEEEAKKMKKPKVEVKVTPPTIEELLKAIDERLQNKKVFIQAEVNEVLLDGGSAREQLESQIQTSGLIENALQGAAASAESLFARTQSPEALAALNGYNQQIITVRQALEEAREKLSQFVGELTVQQEINIDRSVVDGVKAINEEILNDARLRGEEEELLNQRRLTGLDEYKFALEAQLQSLTELLALQPNDPLVVENIRKTKGELVGVVEQIDKIKQSQLSFDVTSALEATERLRRAMTQIPSTTTQITNGFASFAEQANRGLEGLVSSGLNSLTNELDSVVQGTKSAGEAFADFASGVLDQLRKILIQKALVAAIGSVFGDGGEASGDGGSAGFFAEGGQIRGPGGPKSDLVPIWASNKEYMINAQSAQDIGLAELNTLNRFGRAGFERIFKGNMSRNLTEFSKKGTKRVFSNGIRKMQDGGQVDANGNPVNSEMMVPNLTINIENNSGTQISAIQQEGPSLEDGVRNIVYSVIIEESQDGGILQRAAQAGG